MRLEASDLRLIAGAICFVLMGGCQNSRDGTDRSAQRPTDVAFSSSYGWLYTPCDDRELTHTLDPNQYLCDPPYCGDEVFNVDTTNKLASVHGTDAGCRYQDSQVPITFLTNNLRGNYEVLSATLELYIEYVVESPSDILQKKIGVYTWHWFGTCTGWDPASRFVGCNGGLTRIATLVVDGPGAYALEIPNPDAVINQLSVTVFVLADDSEYSGENGEVLFSVATVENKPGRRPKLGLNTIPR